MMQKKSLVFQRLLLFLSAIALTIVPMKSNKKKNPATLDEILQRLNDAEKQFKTIYDSVDFASFKAKESQGEQEVDDKR